MCIKTNKLVIFLDIDGVLNYKYSTELCEFYVSIDDDKTKRLKHIVDETNAEIVLTSTWKEFYSIKGEQVNPIGEYLFKKMTDNGLHISDETMSGFPWNLRGRAIEIYIEQHNVKNYVVLDDEAFESYFNNDIEKHWIKIMHHLEPNEGQYAGLTNYLAEKAIDIINSKAEGIIFDKS